MVLRVRSETDLTSGRAMTTATRRSVFGVAAIDCGAGGAELVTRSAAAAASATSCSTVRDSDFATPSVAARASATSNRDGSTDADATLSASGCVFGAGGVGAHCLIVHRLIVHRLGMHRLAMRRLGMYRLGMYRLGMHRFGMRS